LSPADVSVEEEQRELRLGGAGRPRERLPADLALA
jgi:hypothetical protein